MYILYPSLLSSEGIMATAVVQGDLNSGEHAGNHADDDRCHSAWIRVWGGAGPRDCRGHCGGKLIIGGRGMLKSSPCGQTFYSP